MKIRPEDILSPRITQLLLLSAYAIIITALWWYMAIRQAPLWQNIIVQITYVATATLVTSVLFRTKQTRMFEITPALLAYSVAMSTNVWLTNHDVTDVAISIVLLVTMHISSDLWKTDHPVRRMFIISFLITVVSAAKPSLLLLVPAIWLCFIVLQSFSLRTLLSSLIAIACVVILICGTIYLFIPQFFDPLQQHLLEAANNLKQPFTDITAPEHINTLYCLAAMVAIATFNIIYQKINEYRDEQYTRVQTTTWGIILITIFLLYLAYPDRALNMPTTILTLLLIIHSTAMRPTWSLLVCWVIFFLTLATSFAFSINTLVHFMA